MNPATSHAFSDAFHPVSGASEWWPREKFSSVGADGCCPETIDVTGHGRGLVFGPYVPLEAGVWRATIAFELDTDAARRRYAVQFGVYPNFAEVNPPMRVAGRHEFQLEHDIPPGGLAEVRILMLNAGFHGEMRFFGVRVEKIGPSPEA